MKDGILSTVGNTPLVRLRRLFRDEPFTLADKLEAFNPGGSIKDRAATTMLKSAWASGRINERTVIIESSSGNMGIGLAQACAYLGLRCVCVVDPKITRQNLEILKTYGAEIDRVSTPHPVSGDYLQARLDRVQQLARELPNSYWTDQYSNLDNARAHHQTMEEIVREAGEIDYLFCTTSTCGTLRGCAELVRSTGLRTRIYAVDAMGSVIFGQVAGQRLIPGHGSAVMPNIFHDQLADTCVHVSDLECVVGCRRLLRSEAILAGGSSGAVVAAIDRVRPTLREGSTCVAILPDRGERYLETVYSDAWVHQHFGDVAHLWEDAAAACEKATS